MPIVRNIGPDGKKIAVLLGNGDVHVNQGYFKDPQTGLPVIQQSFIGFVEMQPPLGMVAGGVYEMDPNNFPLPDISIHFGSLEVLDYYINALQQFRNGYVDQVTAITRNAAQA